MYADMMLLMSPFRSACSTRGVAATAEERAELVLKHLLQREPTDAELSEKLEWTLDRTRYVAQVVADARRRYDEELLALIDPEAIDLDDDDDEHTQLDG